MGSSSAQREQYGSKYTDREQHGSGAGRQHGCANTGGVSTATLVRLSSFLLESRARSDALEFTAVRE